MTKCFSPLSLNSRLKSFFVLWITFFRVAVINMGLLEVILSGLWEMDSSSISFLHFSLHCLADPFISLLPSFLCQTFLPLSKLLIGYFKWDVASQFMTSASSTFPRFSHSCLLSLRACLSLASKAALVSFSSSSCRRIRAMSS